MPGFDLTKCLPYDVMHTVFEGVAATHLQALLPYLIEERKFFTLDQLNLLIRSHSYGYSEVQTKPSQIKKDDTYHVKQSGKIYMYHAISIYAFYIQHLK